MAIEWGPYSNHMRVGIDVWTSPYDTYTPSINVEIAVYVQCSPSWNFSDNQHVSLRGSVNGDWDFFNNLGGGQTRLIGRSTIYNQGQSYGGGPTYTLAATLSGNYLGGTSSHTRYFSLPPRPTRVPLPPNPPPSFSNIRATTVRASWGVSPDSGGTPLREDRLQISRNSSFTAVVWDRTLPGNIQDVTGLAPATTYYTRVAVRSDAGWSGWSTTSQGTTADLTAGTPSVSNIGPDGADVSWNAPSDQTPTGYQLVVARNASFTVDASTFTEAWSTTRTLSSLQPGTQYWVRVRFNTPAGYGSWTPTATFETLSGAKVGVNGQWLDAIAYIGVAGSWRQLKVYKAVGGSWVL